MGGRKGGDIWLSTIAFIVGIITVIVILLNQYSPSLVQCGG